MPVLRLALGEGDSPIDDQGRIENAPGIKEFLDGGALGGTRRNGQSGCCLRV
jgi:hypothetical protein